MATIKSAPTPKKFANAWTKKFAGAVRDAAGKDGRLSTKEAERMDPQYADNASNWLEAKDQKSVSVEKLIGQGHNYAFATADKVAGNGNRVSLLEARSLPDDIRGDFFALRGKAEPRLTGAALDTALREAAKLPDGTAVTYMSEADYEVVPFAFGEKVTDANILRLADAQLQAEFNYSGTMPQLAFEKFSPTDSANHLRDLSIVEDDVADDPYYTDAGAAFGRIADAFAANLKDPVVYRIGEAQSDGNIGIDRGLYMHFVVGTDENGKSAGVFYGSVET